MVNPPAFRTSDASSFLLLLLLLPLPLPAAHAKMCPRRVRGACENVSAGGCEMCPRRVRGACPNVSAGPPFLSTSTIEQRLLSGFHFLGSEQREWSDSSSICTCRQRLGLDALLLLQNERLDALVAEFLPGPSARRVEERAGVLGPVSGQAGDLQGRARIGLPGTGRTHDGERPPGGHRRRLTTENRVTLDGLVVPVRAQSCTKALLSDIPGASTSGPAYLFSVCPQVIHRQNKGSGCFQRSLCGLAHSMMPEILDGGRFWGWLGPGCCIVPLSGSQSRQSVTAPTWPQTYVRSSFGVTRGSTARSRLNRPHVNSVCIRQNRREFLRSGESPEGRSPSFPAQSARARTPCSPDS